MIPTFSDDDLDYIAIAFLLLAIITAALQIWILTIILGSVAIGAGAAGLYLGR